MNLNQLEYLKELIYCGNFTQAAQNLGISQPALSIQIRKLEEETELLLIDRRTKPIQLTKDGESYFELVSDILHRIEELKELPFLLANQVKGKLRMGIIPTLAPYFISLFLDELYLKYPELELIVEELITEEIIRKLRTGHLDAGIISTPLEVSGPFHIRPLFYEKFFLYVSDRHSLFQKVQVSMEDLDLNEIWYLSEGNCFRNQVNSICNLTGKQPGKQKLAYQSNSIESLRRMVESKQGLTFIPELSTMQLPSEQEDMIKPITGSDPVRELSLISVSEFVKKRLVDSFTEVALSQLPNHMKRRPAGWVVDTELEID